MKSNILKFVFLVFIFTLTIGCSPETEDTQEQELVTANSLGSKLNPFTCVDPDLETRWHCINYIFVEYEPGITEAEKHEIRVPYCGDMIAIEPCSENPNAEIWTVRGSLHCNEEPSVVPPVDPDLKKSGVSNDCDYQQPFTGI